MRIKSLCMQAFGPFKNKVIIDFESSNIDKGLVLISGDTGAGKTFIFDAICFALYGKTSGDIREVNHLRCDLADDSLDTFVSLKFYYKNKLYEVKRNPEYEKLKKSGKGLTKKAAGSSLCYDDKVLTKISDVNSKIVEIIGLDYKEFRQVAMLSQGEFTKFLLASKDEKTSIFRKIFDTNIYGLIESKLKCNSIEIKDSIDKILEKIDDEKKSISDIVDLNGLNDEEIVNTLNTKINEYVSNIEETKIKRDSINDKKVSLSLKLSSIEKLNNDILIYRDTISKLDELYSNNKDIDTKIIRYNYNINVVSLINKELNLLNKDKHNKEIKMDKLSKDIDKLNILKDNYNKNIDKYNKLDSYIFDIDKLNTKINDINNKIIEFNTYKDSLDKLDKVKKEYSILCLDYDKEYSLYESMKRKYYLNIACILSDTLIDGKACPVCGSIEHPNIAKSDDLSYTLIDIENKEKDVLKLDDKRKSLEAIINQLNISISKFNISVDSLDILNNKLNTLIDKKKSLTIEYNDLTKKKEEIISNIKSLEDNINIYKDDIEVLDNNINSYNINLEDIYNKYNTSYDDYKENYLDNSSLTILKKCIDDYNNTKSDLEAKVKLYDDLKDKDIIDTLDIKNKLLSIEKDYIHYDDIYTLNNTILNRLKHCLSSINNYINKSGSLLNEYKCIKMLSDTANGALVGKKKITFESYVQSYFMNNILIEANKRLLKMTDSRYMLKRKEYDIKLNTKCGLDFCVYDAYTGKERDVTSLSGGEKFKTSLSLALGLSDTISNNKGGIRINSLFIDEGFGSLDSESLNQSLNILSELSSNDKLVAVISHVVELSSRIDKKIYVKKSINGSCVETL